MLQRPQKHFVVSRTLANLAADREIAFSVQGLDEFYVDRHGIRMQPGDLIAIYVVSPVSGFAATVEVISDEYYDSSEIWKGSEGRTYPHRYRTRPRVTLEEGRWVPARDLVPQLEISRGLRDETRWGMMFRNAIRVIPRTDFEAIETRLQEIAPRGRGL